MTLEEKATINEIADSLHERFGKNSLDAGEFADYLGLARQTVCKKIKANLLPGMRLGGKSYIIPVASIALWESRLSNTTEKERY